MNFSHEQLQVFEVLVAEVILVDDSKSGKLIKSLAVNRLEKRRLELIPAELVRFVDIFAGELGKNVLDLVSVSSWLGGLGNKQVTGS